MSKSDLPICVFLSIKSLRICKCNTIQTELFLSQRTILVILGENLCKGYTVLNFLAFLYSFLYRFTLKQSKLFFVGRKQWTI